MIQTHGREFCYETSYKVHPTRRAWRRFYLSLLALIFFTCAMACKEEKHMGEKYMKENEINLTTEPGIPAIAVEAEARYALGYPILVAVILRNETVDTDFLNLPEISLLLPIDSLSAVLQPIKGGPIVRLGPSFTFFDQDLFRTELMAGEVKRMLIDLTQFGQPINPGEYQLSLSIFSRPGVSRSSSSVRVEFIEPTLEEKIEADRLRRLGLRNNGRDYGSWQPFLTSNWNTVSLSETIGEDASHQLALYLCLHKAAYGPESLEHFPLDEIRKLQGPVLSAEAAALEYEILTVRARKNELEITRSRLLQTWPDLKTRLEQIDKGEGLITTLRKGYGAEKPLPPPGRRPYTDISRE